MLSFLSDIVITVLGAYLALTNTMAVAIADALFPDPETEKTELAATDDALTPLPSRYQTIPDILIKNSSYQQAAVAGAVPQTTSTSSSLQDALVNIYCQYTTDEITRTTTGSGFFINDDGVILTNAHVAQFLLLEDAMGVGDSECMIRTGDPATETYTADLLYISPAWIREHAALISEENPQGTGERDYALLYVTGGVENRPIPGRLPFISINTDLVSRDSKGSSVTIGGYPATTLSADNLTLAQATAPTTIVDLFTFDTNYADVISLAGTEIGARGISGGPIVNDQGAAIGLIVTKGDDAIQGAGSLNAITVSYIDRTMREETGLGLAETGSGRLALRSQLFMRLIVPFLTDELEAAL